MSPFGSHAMLHGFLSPSTNVTTLNCSPGGHGGCASVAKLQAKLAAAHTARPGLAQRLSERLERPIDDAGDMASPRLFAFCKDDTDALPTPANGRRYIRGCDSGLYSSA